jgi:hypothetical protein
MKLSFFGSSGGWWWAADADYASEKMSRLISSPGSADQVALAMLWKEGLLGEDGIVLLDCCKVL